MTIDIDTQVRHITKPGANLFRELGFAPSEAERFQAESKQQINDTKALKEQLMGELSKWISDNHLKQADAAQILMVSRPRVSDVVNMKAGKFTIDTLVTMLSRIGKPVRLAIG
ncbi:helix-turn-helix domain-containing protein [soil metagenome]